MLSNFSQKKTFLFVFLSQKNGTLWVDWSTLERELRSPVTHRRASNMWMTYSVKLCLEAGGPEGDC